MSKSPAKAYRDAAIDLTFQFGYGTLDEKQREFLLDLRKYIGIAVRTDYDEVNLKGKGFVYISSDRGSSRFDADTVGSGSPFVDSPWQYDGLLYRVLVHEMGHVFGLPHVGGSVKSFSARSGVTLKSSSLMSEEFPEEIVQRDSYAAFAQFEDLDPFFMPRTAFHDCALTANAKTFFGLPANQDCVHVTFSLKSSTVEVDLYSSTGLEGTRRHLGHASWSDWDKDNSKLNMQAVILERITPKQRVFQFEEGKQPASLVGGMIFGLAFPITFNDANGETREVYLRLEPQTYEAIGWVDGKVVLLLNGK